MNAVVAQMAVRRPLASRAIRFVLTHPIAMKMKRPLKDLWWDVRATRWENPPLPARVQSMVFVCLGNICRSPFAALLAAEQLRAKGVHDVTVTSAGIQASQAHRSPPEACEAATAYGLSLADHVPRALTTELVDASDVIVVMETAQALELAARYPQHRDRIVLLSLYDSAFSRGHGRYNIADPFGESLAAFGECYRRLDRAVTAFTDAIAATARAGRC